MGVIGNLVRSISVILPEVPKPTRKPSLNEKLIWTAIALTIYLTMAQIPLFGVPVGGQDQLAFTRIIFASAHGTLMELGIGPIVTAGLILQLLKGADIIKVDFKKPGDRALFTSSTKLLTILVVLGESVAYLIGGAFGQNLSFTTAIIIIIQLLAAGIMVVMLDEICQKGWGLGSGISLFIMAGVAQTIIWNIFSILPTGDGYFGVIPFTISSALSGVPGDAWFRPGALPSISTLIITLVLILIIVYIEGIRIEIPITSTRYRGFSGVHPLKLMYVSVIPIILTGAVSANLTFVSQILWRSINPENTNSLFNLLVTFNSTNPGLGPTGGIVRYISAPTDPSSAMADPVRAITSLIFMIIFAVIFSKIWVEIAGLSSKAVAKNLMDANVHIPGFRRAQSSVESILNRYIPSLTIISGVLIGLIAGVSQMTGVFGSGTGILLMIGIVIQYYQILMREQLDTMMPRLAGMLGKG
tara:strand:+ start:391 stop:1803 length:1413 start_codon:yes stop_codon:yes gene_type:complete